MGQVSSASGQRVDFIDALRGFALMGLFLVHVCEMYELYWLESKPSWVHDWVFAAFAEKSYAILALCFGFSFQAMEASAKRRGEAFAPRFVRRLVLLFAIGCLHGLIYRGDIVSVLAPLGLLLLPMFGLRDRKWLIGLSLAFFLNPFVLARTFAALAGAAFGRTALWFSYDPAMLVYAQGDFGQTVAANIGPGNFVKWAYMIESGRITQILGLFLCGAMLGAANWFGTRHSWRHLGLLIAGSLIAVLGLNWANSAALVYFSQPPMANHIGMLITGWRALAAVMLWACVLMALWQTNWRWLMGWLGAPGRMTLTLYIGESLVFVPVFYHFGLNGWAWMSQEQCLALGVVSFGLQAVFAHWWMARFAYGPLEWVWRAATLGSMDLPFRKKATARA
jgi:uncharacterized protein